jgi:hypothetical protein
MLRVLGGDGSRALRSVSGRSTDSFSLTHKPSQTNLVTTVNDLFSMSSARIERINELMLKMKSEQQSDDQDLLSLVWAPTFGYLERFKCFWRAPITLFWFNSIYRLTLAVVSCWYLVRMQTSAFDTKYLSQNTSAAASRAKAFGHTGFLQNTTLANSIDSELVWGSPTDICQWVLGVHYSMQLFVLLVRVLIFGWREYAHEIWPWFEIIASICYVVAFAIKYLDTVEAFYRLVKTQLMLHDYYQVERARLFFLMQGVSAMFLVIRCMRIFSAIQFIGEYVLIYLSMFKAIFSGLLIGMILWIAFTFARMGLTALCQTYPSYLLDGFAADGFDAEATTVFCTDSFQNAFAVIFNMESGNGYDGQMTELWFLYAIVWFTFNLVLVNLYIASMSTQYAESSRQATKTWIIDRHTLTQEYSCFSLVFGGPLLSVPFFFIPDFFLFCWHYRALQELYPSCSPRALLLLHLSRSNAHDVGLAFSWKRGLNRCPMTLSTGDVDEVEKLQCFMENARRHFTIRHFPGQQHIKLEDVGLLTDNPHAVTMGLKIDSLSAALMGALDVMRSTADGMQSNKGALDKLAADTHMNRDAIRKLSKETGVTGVLPPQPAKWTQQAVAVDKKGFFMQNASGGFGASGAKPNATKPAGGGGFGATLTRPRDTSLEDLRTLEAQVLSLLSLN